MRNPDSHKVRPYTTYGCNRTKSLLIRLSFRGLRVFWGWADVTTRETVRYQCQTASIRPNRRAALRSRVMSPHYRQTSPPWRDGPASTPWGTSSRWSAWKRKARHAITARTVAADPRRSWRLPQTDPELFQQGRGGIAVRHHCETNLLAADRVAQIKIDVALEVVHLVAEGRELLLQGDARGT